MKYLGRGKHSAEELEEIIAELEERVSNSELGEWLPCPFCGQGETVGLEKDSETGQYNVICNIHENGCGGSSAYKFTPSEAINAWNKRAK